MNYTEEPRAMQGIAKLNSPDEVGRDTTAMEATINQLENRIQVLAEGVARIRKRARPVLRAVPSAAGAKSGGQTHDPSVSPLRANIEDLSNQLAEITEEVFLISELIEL